MYGLHLSGLLWQEKLDKVLTSLGMVHCEFARGIYRLVVGKPGGVFSSSGEVVALAYVDDILLSSNCVNLLNEVIQHLSSEIEIESGNVNEDCMFCCTTCSLGSICESPSGANKPSSVCRHSRHWKELPSWLVLAPPDVDHVPRRRPV